MKNSKEGSHRQSKQLKLSLKVKPVAPLTQLVPQSARKPLIASNHHQEAHTMVLKDRENNLKKSKSRADSTKRISKASISSHSRKISMQQNSRKESIVLNISRGQSSEKRNRSSSYLTNKQKESHHSFKIDISTILQKKKKEQQKQDRPIGKQDFVYHYVIGKGGFGKVWSVELKKNKKAYAMKEMLKTKIITKKSIDSVMNQRRLLSGLKHPFIVNMQYAFQDRLCLYLVMDLLTGGDLRYYIGRRRSFKESETKFFIACVLLGLQYLHSKEIIHRDIKPENLVLDEKGYLRITDLGIAREYRQFNSSDTSGTPGYMAPEVMCRQDHNYCVDYYAVGVIAYQLMLGKRPYQGRTRKEIRDQVLAKQVQVHPQQMPADWSVQAMDFVNKMIQRKPCNRLGWNGIDEIKNHPWLKGFAWNKLLQRQLAAPFVPKKIGQNHDYLQQISSTSDDEIDGENQLLLRRKSVEQLFEGYTHTNEPIKKKTNLATTNNTYASEDGKLKPTKKHNFFF